MLFIDTLALAGKPICLVSLKPSHVARYQKIHRERAPTDKSKDFSYSS